MLKRNMVHILGSDSHGTGNRNFCLKESIKEIQKNVDYDITSLVTKNPQSIIRGETIEIPEVVSLKKQNFLSRLRQKMTK